MNNVYIYDSSQIHVYETEDFGSITDVAATVVDHGVKMFDYIVQDGTPGVINGDFIVPVGQDYIVNEVTGYIDYEDVWITETLYPVSGNINFSGGEENSATIVFVATAEPIILRERAIVIRKQAWIGSGSLLRLAVVWSAWLLLILAVLVHYRLSSMVVLEMIAPQASIMKMQ